MTEHYFPSMCETEIAAVPRQRRESVGVRVGSNRGAVVVGGGAPVVVQSMTNTDTADVDSTVRQVAALAQAGSELVRITVDRDEAAAAVPKIREKLDALGISTPLVGDFHYIGHKLLADHPACAEALAKYRINPGNVGFKEKKDKQFGPSSNWRSTRQGRAHWRQLGLARSGDARALMDENALATRPIDARAVTREALVRSALLSAERAEEIGLSATESSSRRRFLASRI